MRVEGHYLFGHKGQSLGETRTWKWRCTFGKLEAVLLGWSVALGTGKWGPGDGGLRSWTEGRTLSQGHWRFLGGERVGCLIKFTSWEACLHLEWGMEGVKPLERRPLRSHSVSRQGWRQPLLREEQWGRERLGGVPGTEWQVRESKKKGRRVAMPLQAWLEATRQDTVMRL